MWEITDEFVAEWNRVRSKLDAANGGGVTNSAGSITHAPPDEHAKDAQNKTKVKFKVVGPIVVSGANSPGRYTANPITGFTNKSPSTLAEADLGTVATGKTVELWNLPEIGNTVGLVPTLSAGDFISGTLHGQNSTTGNPIYHVEADDSSILVGKWCAGSNSAPDCGANIPTFTDVADSITKQYFLSDDYVVGQQKTMGATCNPSAVLIENKYNTIICNHYTDAQDVASDTKIIQLVDDSLNQDTGVQIGPPATKVDKFANTADSYNRYSVYWSLAQKNTNVDPASCLSGFVRNGATIKGSVYIDPADFPGGSLAVYSDATILTGASSYAKVDAKSTNRMQWLDETISTSHDAAVVTWMGFTAKDCNGTAIGSASGPAVDGFIGFKVTKGIAGADLGGGILELSLNLPTVTVNVTGGSGSGSFDVSTPCAPILTVNVDPNVSFTITIGTVTTLSPGSSATASISGSYPSYTLDLGIPAGADGTNGTNGSDGTNGTNGTNGSDGAPGLNPTSLPDGNYPLSATAGLSGAYIVVSGGQITGIVPGP